MKGISIWFSSMMSLMAILINVHYKLHKNDGEWNEIEDDAHIEGSQHFVEQPSKLMEARSFPEYNVF